jgi:hypothetical protein
MNGPEHRVSVVFASLPWREFLVAELWVGGIQGVQMAEVNQEGDELEIEIYAREDGEPWRVSCRELADALAAAGRRLRGDEWSGGAGRTTST